jgi:hypothetical protein
MKAQLPKLKLSKRFRFSTGSCVRIVFVIFPYLLIFTQSIAVMGYCITLIVLSVIAGNRGHTVWKSSVRETNFFAPGPSVAQPEVDKTEYSPYPAPAQGYQGAGNYSPYAAPAQGYRGAGNV